MRAPRTNLPLLLGLIASLGGHLFVLMPLLVGTMNGPPRPPLTLARFDPEDFLDEPAPEESDPDELQLGLEDGSPSTLTWIGYETYQEHLARLGDVEQAAFEDAPIGDDGETPLTADVPAEPLVAEGRPDVQPAEPAEVAAAPPESEIDDPVTPSTELDPAQATAKAPEGATVEADPSRELADLLAGFLKTFGAAARAPAYEQSDVPDDLAHLRPPEDGRDDPAKEDPAEQPAKEPAGAEAAKDTPRPADQQPGVPSNADRADKESDATSTIEVPLDQINLGRPLAALGLELQPRRPRLTSLQRVTASVANPVVEISFGRDGVPRRAVILASSGNRGIDTAIESSLYRWRAKGKPLEALGKDETIPVRMQILFHSRRGG